jgi:hypothetical protein
MQRGEKLLIVLLGVCGAFIAGAVVRELIPGWEEAGAGAAIGLPTIVALFGMFWVADSWKDALTASFAVAYFIFLAGIVSIFLFAGRPLELEGGTKILVDNFTTLVAVVLGSYFGEAALAAWADAHKAAKIAEAAARSSQPPAP